VKRKVLAASVAGVLSGLSLIQRAQAEPAVKSVEFIGMAPPATLDERTDIYTGAQMKVTYRNGKVKTYDLKYNQLMATTEEVNGKLVGGLFDVNGDPILYPDEVADEIGGEPKPNALGGQQVTSDAPDGNSLMVIPGMRAANPWKNRPLALVTHYEYRGLTTGLPPLEGGEDYWSRLPALMSLALIDQDKRSGALDVTDYNYIDFAKVYGGWIHCAGSLSPWNTHLGSEEYEPDAKTREGLPKATGSDDGTDINSFSYYYFGTGTVEDSSTANAYHYGLTPEVKVRRNGTTSVEKHYALGRIAREVADVQPDARTVYMGDDGKYTGLFLFVADWRGYLSRGTLYAGKWEQTSPKGSDGGSADIQWIKLGHASDAEIKDMVDFQGIEFTDIFDVRNQDPDDPTFTKVHTYTGIEWLKLRTSNELGMSQEDIAKAAAFLETRRYAAYLGATTEFNKMEGVTHNARDKKTYIVISRVENGMSDDEGDIQLAKNKGGALYELALKGRVKDSDGDFIPSRYAAVNMVSIPKLLGSYDDNPATNPGAVDGNFCPQDKVCDGDNIKYSEAMRTLFIGEDTGYRQNDYVWAYNVDTEKLSLILSVPAGAEATGLQVVDDYNGFAYIMGNFQHPGEFSDGNPDWEDNPDDGTPGVESLLNSKWNNRLKAAIGYIGTEDGALPAIK